MKSDLNFIKLGDLDSLNDTSAYEVASSAFLAWKVVRNAFKCFICITAITLISSWWSLKLLDMKEGILFIPLGSHDIFKGFAHTPEELHDVMVFWCETCDLRADSFFVARSLAVVQALNGLQAEEQVCSDLQWSDFDRPDAGLGKQGSEFYVSEDQTTTFIEFHSSSMRCMVAARKELKTFTISSGRIRMALGGPESVADASMSAEFKTSLRHSMIAMPICALMLWTVTGNVFRASSPILCVGASYLTGKAVVGVVKCWFPALNVNYDDSAVLFVVLALCNDYALFLWTRFSDMRAKYSAPDDYSISLVAAVHKSGTVIVISNCFVTTAYGCTMLLPFMNLWGYLGLYLQAAIACVCSMIYSLTLLPALAATFPSMFDGSDSVATRWIAAFCDFCCLPSSRDVWLKWARIVTRGPFLFLIPAIAYACMLSCIIPLGDYKPSFDVEVQGVRHDVIESFALDRFESKFRIGMLMPTTIVFQAEHLGPAANHTNGEDLTFKNVALSSEFGSRVCEFAESIKQATRGKDCEISSDDMLSLWWLPKPRPWPWPWLLGNLPPGENGCALSYPRVRGFIERYENVPDPLTHLPERMLKLIPHVLLESLSKDGHQMQLKVITSFRPMRPEAYHFDQIVRELIAKADSSFESSGQLYAFRVTHASPMQIQVDASIGMMQALPNILGTFLPLAAMAIGFWFRSAFLAIKLALTVIVPIVTTYGMAVAVYQMDALSWTGITMLQGTYGLDFRMVILTAGILFGFAMDYDLFLFVRVYEYRLAGFDNQSAVKRALVETGPVITTAGIMMVFSFFCIMCSHTIFLRTMGFIFTVGVSFDVLVVRTMIAPPFLTFAECLNYWPGRMPKPIRTWD